MGSNPTLSAMIFSELQPDLPGRKTSRKKSPSRFSHLNRKFTGRRGLDFCSKCRRIGLWKARIDPVFNPLIADPLERGTLNRHLQRLDLPLATAKQETAAALLEPPGLLLRCRLAPLVPRALIQFLLLAIIPFSLKE